MFGVGAKINEAIQLGCYVIETMTMTTERFVFSCEKLINDSVVVVYKGFSNG